MSTPRVKLSELREVLAIGLIVAGAIANVVWLGFAIWIIASELGRALLFIAERLR